MVVTKTLAFLLACLAFIQVTFAGNVTIYPFTNGITPSQDFKVFAAGTEAFVYASPVPASYCGFDLSGPADIVVKANRDVKWVDIRPRSAAVKFTFKDSSIYMHLKHPVQLSIEINGSIKSPLFLFANPPQTHTPTPNDTGVTVFKAGKVYYAGIIQLHSNQQVYIEGGAVVVGVIAAKGAKNVSVRGRGILDGTFNDRLDKEAFRNTDTAKIFSAEKGSYHRFLEFMDCSNVVVEGITLNNSTSWQIVPINCNGVSIHDVKIISDQPSDDGMDIVRSRHGNISKCFIRTKDDCIAIKADFDYPETVVTSDIHTEKCVLWNGVWGNGIEIGFELDAAEVKNISFTNCDIIHVQDGAAISIHNAGKAVVSNIRYEDLRIEDANQKLFDFAIFRSRYGADSVDASGKLGIYLNGAWDGVLYVPHNDKQYFSRFRGNILGVVIKDVAIVDGIFPYSLFNGFDNTHTVKNVFIQNLTVHGKKIQSLTAARFYTKNVSGIIIQ